MPTAVFVDAGFFLKRFRKVYPTRNPADAIQVARTLHEMALDHLRQRGDAERKDLYRIFVYDVSQKGTDMKIGLDIASVAYKRQADQIVLVAGDSDFVPAAKLARREGVDFILDPMWSSIADDLHEHVDGLRSTSPRPSGTTG